MVAFRRIAGEALVVTVLAASSGLIDAGDTTPTDELKPPAYPFVDWTGKATYIRFLEVYRSYFWDREFHLRFAREGTKETWDVVSRASTPYNGWRMGPTYTGLKVDWAKKPKLRIVGVQKIDRYQEKFHDIPLDKTKTITAFILFVWQDEKWQEYYVNNWYHTWVEGTAGLHTKDIARYYVDRGKPYDVYGWLHSAGSDEVWDARMPALVARCKRKAVYHGLLVSDATRPLGYRLKLLHFWEGRNCLLGDAGEVEKLNTVK